jgi:segregation and condensation protein B
MNIENIEKIAQKIEGYLFWKGEPVTMRNLVKVLDVDIETIDKALDIINAKKETTTGIILIRYDDMITLGTHSNISSFIENMIKDDLQKELGKSALETLAIILYQGPVKRTDIDYIRGVNSQFILRNLLMRGLITRVDDPKDERVFLYNPSLELLSFLGITGVKELPDFEEVVAKLSAFKLEKEPN